MRLFVTGTDTGVGKTEVSAALLSVLVAQGHRPFACKPWESGGRVRASDAERLWRAAGAWQRNADVCLYRLKAPLAPAIAARLEGRRLSFERVVRHVRGLGQVGVVEGAGGLYVPVGPQHDVIDLVRALAFPVVLVARAGLGTINHTTLSLRALQGVPVAGVVLMQSTRAGDRSIASNRVELQRRFPHVRFVGPVPFEGRAARRQQVVQRAVEPLLVS
jgi:dethiobiotin synthetase